MSASLHLYRPRRYTGMVRRIRIFLDGVELTRIKNGEEQTLDIAAGEPSLTLKSDWMKSKPYHFSIEAGQTLGLLCFFNTDNLWEFFKGSFAIPCDGLLILARDAPEALPLLTPLQPVSTLMPKILARSGIWAGAMLALGFLIWLLLEPLIANPDNASRAGFGIGLLVGYLVIFGSAWIVYETLLARRASKQTLRSNRWFMLGFLGVVVTGVAVTVAVGLHRQQGRQHRNMLAGCVQSCQESGATAKLCTNYCDCTVTGILNGDSGIDLALLDANYNTTQQRLTAVQQSCLAKAQRAP